MQNLFFSMVHCKPNLEVFIKRLATTEPTKDWVLYSQFLGKFRNLRDAENTLFENINRVFERDGIISE